MKYTDAELRSLIIERFSAPKHRCLPNHKWERAKTWEVRSESCSDRLQLTVVLKNNKVQQACFDGHACAIAIASADLILDKIIGQDLTTLTKVLDQYQKLITQGVTDKVDKAVLDNLIAFKNIHRQRNRKACALLVTDGLHQLLADYDK